MKIPAIADVTFFVHFEMGKKWISICLNKCVKLFKLKETKFHMSYN